MTRIVVTGANRGIGLELVRQLAARGAQVVAVCRESSPELDVAGAAQVLAGVDVTDTAGISALSAELGSAPIDCLINNAGVLIPDSLESLDVDAIRRQFEVNSLAPLRITAALAERLPRGGKVAVISSRMGSISDNSSGSMYGYRMSKAAANAVGKSLARDLAARGVAVVVLHPGYVQTRMTGGNGEITAETAASQLISRIDELTLEGSGRFIHAKGEELPW